MPIKDENDPVTDDEYLLRRVYKDKFRTENTPLISPRAFEPRIGGRDPDINGISLYRESCQEATHDVMESLPELKRNQSGVVRISVLKLKELGLSVELDQDKQFGIAGHVIIPELNCKDFAASKAKYKPIILALSEEASQDANVLIEPETD